MTQLNTIPSSNLIKHQIKLEETYSKNQLVPRIKAEFEKEPQFKEHMIANGIPYPFGLDLLVQMAIHKRANLQTLVGLLYHHFKSAQLTADMLLKCAEADLVNYVVHREGEFVVIFTISEDVQADLDRFQFPLPMVVPPQNLTTNMSNGYYTGKSSVILKNNHHNDDVCLDHLNRLNKVRFVINNDTASMVHNRWKSLDKPKEGETREKFTQRKRQFEKYDRTTKDVMALLTKESESFHLTHAYDKRGRTYCVGYHCTYQGASWNKAVLELADKELCE